MADDVLDGLWLFDGVCNFCLGSVQVALRLDRRGNLRFTPLQSPFGQALASRYGLDLDNPDSFLFLDTAARCRRPTRCWRWPPGWGRRGRCSRRCGSSPRAGATPPTCCSPATATG